MNESNPVISRLWRGEGVESIHRGAWVVVNTDSEIIDGRGDPNQLVYARSSTKSIQALPMFETGTTAALSLTDEEIAVAVSSHTGEQQHVDAARSILTKAGLTASSLLCGPQAPSGSAHGAAAERITNNCSGKHAGFLATAVALGDDPSAYLSPDSEVQHAVRRAVVEVTGASETEVSTSIDGCSAPTFRLPLASLATGLARMANPRDLPPVRASACTQILGAARRHPEMIAGTVTPRFDTDLLAATDGRLFAKAGADGVQTVGDRRRGGGLRRQDRRRLHPWAAQTHARSPQSPRFPAERRTCSPPSVARPDSSELGRHRSRQTPVERRGIAEQGLVRQRLIPALNDGSATNAIGFRSDIDRRRAPRCAVRCGSPWSRSRRCDLGRIWRPHQQDRHGRPRCRRVSILDLLHRLGYLDAARGIRITRALMRHTAAGGIALGLDVALFFSAVKETTIVNATVISALQPVLVGVVAWRFFGERVGRRDISLAAAAIVATFVVVAAGTSQPEWNLFGDILAVGSVIAWSGYFIFSKASRGVVTSSEYTLGTALWTCIINTPLALIFGQDLSWPNATNWAWLIALALSAGIVGHVVMNWSLVRIPLWLGSTLTLLIPVSAASLAWVVLDQALTTTQIVAMAAVLVTLALLVSGQTKPDKSPVAETL